MSTTLIFILLIIYTLAVSYIGYRNRNIANSEDYFLASRRLPSWLLAITFIASWWGGGSAIDLVDQAHGQGLSTFWIYGVPVLIATALMYMFAGRIRGANTISQPEMVEKRYDSRVAFMLMLFILVFMVISSAVQVIVIGRLFSSFTGLSYEWCATLGTLLVLFYSMFGGFRGVVITDLFQFIFCLLSAIFLFCITYNLSGGFQAVEQFSVANNREWFTDFFHNLDNNLAYVITFGASWMVQANVWQRISAARTPHSARNMMAISFVLFIPLYLIVTFTGMFSSLIYETVPKGGVVATLLFDLHNPIIGGVIFIGLCSAVMSTMDSMFNTGALTLTIDLYKRHISPNNAPNMYVLVGRISTIIVGLLALFIGIKIQSVLTISWIGADFIATGAFIPLVLGFVWKRGTATAALTSMIFGLLFSSYNLAAALGAPLPIAWEIASVEQAIIGITTSATLYITISLLTGVTNKESS